MLLDKVIKFGDKNAKKSVIIFLGSPLRSYITHDTADACMIEAWDIHQALEIFLLNNPPKKRRRPRRVRNTKQQP